MAERRGWLLDLYPDGRQGLVVWLLGEDGGRYRLRQPFPVTFYAAGPAEHLRRLWRFLQREPLPIRLGRTQRRDLFSGLLDVMAIEVGQPAAQPGLLRRLERRFPDLVYYDADIPLSLRYAAATGVFPLTYCAAVTEEDEEGGEQIRQINPLSSRWEIDSPEPPLRILQLAPDANPSHAAPRAILATTAGETRALPLDPGRHLLLRLQAQLKRHDPDIILTRWGDTWLLPYLLALREREGAGYFYLNRDEARPVVRRRPNSYHTYGQIIYRGGQVHLRGRWHIDQTNAMMYGEYGLAGVFEQARVSGLPVRRSPANPPGPASPPCRCTWRSSTASWSPTPSSRRSGSNRPGS